MPKGVWGEESANKVNLAITVVLSIFVRNRQVYQWESPNQQG